MCEKTVKYNFFKNSKKLATEAEAKFDIFSVKEADWAKNLDKRVQKYILARPWLNYELPSPVTYVSGCRLTLTSNCLLLTLEQVLGTFSVFALKREMEHVIAW